MNDLRLIILIVGLVFIAGIYIWGTIKQRNQQRRQTIQHYQVEDDLPEIRVSSVRDPEEDFSNAISDLNEFLAKSKRLEDEVIAERVSVQLSKDKGQNLNNENGLPDTKAEDLFSSVSEDNIGSREKAPASADPGNIDEDQIIKLHITTSGVKAFNGGEILEAVNTVGMEYGDMSIFHHYGIGQMKMDRPLFSLADMFEPGSFDLEKIDAHNTQGLILFLYLPVPIDGQVVFELMLNTAQRLANILSGEIRGPDQDLINDDQIAAIRDKIDLYKY